jgi:hypothetical protein
VQVGTGDGDDFGCHSSILYSKSKAVKPIDQQLESVKVY